MVQAAAMPAHTVHSLKGALFSLVNKRRRKSNTQHLLRPIAIKFKILDENTSWRSVSVTTV
jgi:hypothetical protein